MDFTGCKELTGSIPTMCVSLCFVPQISPQINRFQSRAEVPLATASSQQTQSQNSRVCHEEHQCWPGTREGPGSPKGIAKNPQKVYSIFDKRIDRGGNMGEAFCNKLTRKRNDANQAWPSSSCGKCVFQNPKLDLQGGLAKLLQALLHQVTAHKTSSYKVPILMAIPIHQMAAGRLQRASE